MSPTIDDYEIIDKLMELSYITFNTSQLSVNDSETLLNTVKLTEIVVNRLIKALVEANDITNEELRTWARAIEARVASYRDMIKETIQ